MMAKEFTYEDLRNDMGRMLLELGRLRAELEATKRNLSRQRKVVWSTMPFTEVHCKERSLLWSIKAERAHLRDSIRQCKATINDLERKVADIGFKEHQPEEDPSDEDDYPDDFEDCSTDFYNAGDDDDGQ